MAKKCKSCEEILVKVKDNRYYCEECEAIFDGKGKIIEEDKDLSEEIENTIEKLQNVRDGIGGKKKGGLLGGLFN